jgi:hypothetical protein
MLGNYAMGGGLRSPIMGERKQPHDAATMQNIKNQQNIINQISQKT